MIIDNGLSAQNIIVSILMITYNHVNYIADAIEGVLAQKASFPFELIIGEDCSTDGTRDIVFDYQRKYPSIIRVITSESNVGAIRNSRRAIVAARGKYVAWCEGDDYWHHPYKLQMQVDFLEQHSDYLLVHGNADFFFVESSKRMKNAHLQANAKHTDGSGVYLRIINQEYPIYTLTACAKREKVLEVIDKNPFEFSEEFPMNDTQLWLELSRLGKVKTIHESLATRNILSESATRSRDIQKLIRFQLLSRKLVNHYLDKYECPDYVRKNAISTSNRRLLKLASKAGDRSLAEDSFIGMKIAGCHLTMMDYLLIWCSNNHLLNAILLLVIALVSASKTLLADINKIAEVKFLRLCRIVHVKQ